MRNWDALKVPIKTLPDVRDSERLLGTLKLERENKPTELEKEGSMYDIEQLSNAQSAVYVMSNPDGSDCEFLNLRQKASVSELEALRARWAGRDLHGAGVAYLAHGIPCLVLKQEPPDFMTVVRLTAAFARYVDMIANDRTEQLRADDSVMWCELLYALPDTRSLT